MWDGSMLGPLGAGKSPKRRERPLRNVGKSRKKEKETGLNVNQSKRVNTQWTVVSVGDGHKQAKRRILLTPQVKERKIPERKKKMAGGVTGQKSPGGVNNMSVNKL